MTTKQKRPLPIRLSPPRLRTWLFYHIYRARRERWKSLYLDARLEAADASMRLLCGDTISDQLAFTGIYEPALTSRVVQLSRMGGTMIDVGANLGYFSILWAATNPSNRCIAFEASPRNLNILRENIGRNGLEERIRLVPCAASAQPGHVRFDVGPDDQTGWGGITLKQGGGAIEVEAVRVDEVVSSEESIALLKIDTEGADTLVLMGCEALLKRKMVREIWFEQNQPRMETLGIRPGQAQDFLQSVGYTCIAHGDPRGVLVEWSAVPK